MEPEPNLEKRLKDSSWKVRKQTYERLLYFLQSGDKDVSFGGQLVTLDKVTPLLNSLTEQQNAFVVIEGMQCIKLIASQHSFKISNINHFLSEGLQKFSVSDKLQAEFESILNSLMDRWTAYFTGLLISKFENKNPRIITFCLKVLSSNLKRIIKNKEAAANLYKSIQHLCCSQNKTIRLNAMQINNSLEEIIGKKPVKQTRSNLSEIYNELLKSFDQMDTTRRIDIAGQLRKVLQQIQFTIQSSEDHFTLIYCLRMMIEDSNQLLWSQGVKVLTLLVERGLKLKEIGYLIDKLRVGKYAANQLVFQLFDLIVIMSAKKTEDYIFSLQQLFDNSNRENIKVGILQLILRLAYLVNKLSGNEETCLQIESKVFSGMPLFQTVSQSSNIHLKNRLISCYNKQILKWLVSVHASARYKELTQEIVLAMKPFQDKYATSDKNIPTEKQNKRPLQTDSKAQGLDKIIQQVLMNHHSAKQLDRKMGKAAEFLAQQSQRYEDSFYFIELVSRLSINLSHIKLSPQCGQKLSGFVVFLLKHFLKRYSDPDIVSCNLFLQVLLKRLCFSKDESRLRDILSEFAARQKLFAKIFTRLEKIDFKPKRSTLRFISQWLIDNARVFSRCNDYYEILDSISTKIQSLQQQKLKKIAVQQAQKIKERQNLTAAIDVQKIVINNYSSDQKIVNLDQKIGPIQNVENLTANKIESIESDRELSGTIQRHVINSVQDTLDIDDIRGDISHLQEGPSYEFEHIGNIQQHGIPFEQMKARLAAPKNCFFFLKNEVYQKIKITPIIDDKLEILKQLLEVISVAEISDIGYENLINTLFMLFVEIRRCPELANQLQNIYQALRQKKTPKQFMVGLLKSAKPIFQSISEPDDCEFAASILARSLERLAEHVQKSDYLNLLCDINDFFQLGEVVYFELYKKEYKVVTDALFKSTKKWLGQLDETDAAAVLDTFESLFDSSFKHFVEQQLTVGLH